MKTYQPFKLEIVEFFDEVIRTSGETENTSGVYEHVSELDPATKADWF